MGVRNVAPVGDVVGLFASRTFAQIRDGSGVKTSLTVCGELGIAIAAKMPMMATTTNSSIKVNHSATDFSRDHPPLDLIQQKPCHDCDCLH